MKKTSPSAPAPGSCRRATHGPLPHSRPGTLDDLVIRQVLVENQYGLPEELSEEDVILDVGAHVGAFAVACLERGAGLVVCYEPDPVSFDLLQKNLSALYTADRYELHQKAISLPGLASVKFASSTSYGSDTACACQRPDGDLEVEAVSLQHALGLINPPGRYADTPVRLLKFDAEGAEWQAFPHVTFADLKGVQEIVGESHLVSRYEHCDIGDWLRPCGFHTVSEGLPESRTAGGQYINHLFRATRAPAREGKKRVLLMRFPYGGSERGEVGDWLVSAALWAERDGRVADLKIGRMNDTPITMTRNKAARIAVDGGYDLLLMIDSDMVPDCEGGAPRFLQTAFDFWWGHAGPCVIGAPYCGPPPDETPYVFVWRNTQNDTPEPESRITMYTREEAADMSGTQRCAALPTGLILIDVKAFASLESPYFYYEYQDEHCQGKASTEDVTFSRDLDFAGVPLYCTWDCWAGHVKTKVVKKPQVIRLGALPGKFCKAVIKQHEDGHVRGKGYFPASCG